LWPTQLKGLIIPWHSAFSVAILYWQTTFHTVGENGTVCGVAGCRVTVMNVKNNSCYILFAKTNALHTVWHAKWSTRIQHYPILPQTFFFGNFFPSCSHLNHMLYAEFVLRSPARVIASYIIYKPDNNTWNEMPSLGQFVSLLIMRKFPCQPAFVLKFCNK